MVGEPQIFRRRHRVQKMNPRDEPNHNWFWPWQSPRPWPWPLPSGPTTPTPTSSVHSSHSSSRQSLPDGRRKPHKHDKLHVTYERKPPHVTATSISSTQSSLSSTSMSSGPSLPDSPHCIHNKSDITHEKETSVSETSFTNRKPNNMHIRKQSSTSLTLTTSNQSIPGSVQGNLNESVILHEIEPSSSRTTFHSRISLNRLKSRECNHLGFGVAVIVALAIGFVAVVNIAVGLSEYTARKDWPWPWPVPWPWPKDPDILFIVLANSTTESIKTTNQTTPTNN